MKKAKLHKMTEKEAEDELYRLKAESGTTLKFSQWLHGWEQNIRVRNHRESGMLATLEDIKIIKRNLCEECGSKLTTSIDNIQYCLHCQNEQEQK